MRTRLAAVLAALLLVAQGCSLAGRSVQQYVDDQTITGRVKIKLAGLRASHLTRVNVDTFDGVVYLSGTVDSPADKSDAEVAARQVPGVRQVVNDLQAGDAVAAAPASLIGHPLQERVRGLARVEMRQPAGPAIGYDAAGRVVATVHTITARQLAESGVDGLVAADGRPIVHVSVYPEVARTDRPVPHYSVILWHVSEADAAALR
ncbi:MAG TPA: BON domain-containing protein [Candidatus Tectomicrobia bacterium]|nr:BON domain-containing protein [Candidatus Tectomicrobia bacterium]